MNNLLAGEKNEGVGRRTVQEQLQVLARLQELGQERTVCATEQQELEKWKILFLCKIGI